MYRVPRPGFGKKNVEKVSAVQPLFLLEKKVFTPFLVAKKSSPPFYFWKKLLAPFFISSKNGLMQSHENQSLYLLYVSYSNEHNRVAWPNIDNFFILKNDFQIL